MANPWMSKYKENDPFKKKDIIPGGGGYRDVHDAPYVGPSIGTEQYGQGQLQPGWQHGGTPFWIDHIGGGFGNIPDSDWYGNLGELWDSGQITNMQDLYDWWAGGSTHHDTFMDFMDRAWGWDWDWTNVQDNDAFGTHNWGGGTSGMSGTGILSGSDVAGQWGSSGIGGQGDLGTGNVFIGGGMASGAYGGGMSGQDCASLGPQFNSAGECIACCGEQYAGTGFYGSVEEFTPDTGSVDPSMSGECFEQYQATMGAGYQGSYEEFAGLYC